MSKKNKYFCTKCRRNFKTKKQVVKHGSLIPQYYYKKLNYRDESTMLLRGPLVVCSGKVKLRRAAA